MPLPIGRMRALVLTGQATRLFPTDPVGPTRYHGRWWIVLTGRDEYVPADARRAAALDNAADRIATAEPRANDSIANRSGNGRKT